MVIHGLTETAEGRTVFDALGIPYFDARARPVLRSLLRVVAPDLLVVCGWRRILTPELLAIPRLGAVGFHSARLPEYPGRAPVPWTLVRGDREATTTLFWLTEEVDAGDIVDAASVPVGPGDTVETVYARLAEADIELLRRHLPGLLDGTAPRQPQDRSRRGPLTTAEGWDRYWERQRLAAGHA